METENKVLTPEEDKIEGEVNEETDEEVEKEE